ncbi:enoyl-CoA hydratase/isomerase family protein [Brevibacillus sp. RS1.1]|uniref:enoyl-CoA hydratase/isomerase family protein n=1 Tax=Brevibacillus sp. RS1.1 TaxID=2738982 RepID=UPI0020C4D341|nr:enoyl-CoA hydratase-related protein [Brevibacillus sp. RS1.1]
MMSHNDVVLYSIKNRIATIALNRPESLNALNREVLEQLSVVLEKAKIDQEVKAVIITGTGEKVFSAGADIKFLNSATPLEVRDFAKLAVEVTCKIESLGKVVVAALNGSALGGGLEIAESCMLRIAVNHARIGHPEVRIGAVAGFGGITRLPRLVGKGRAAELLLTGNSISAEEAYTFGLINRVVEPENLLPEAENLLQEILAQSPIAVTLTWEALHRGLNVTLEESAHLGADFFGLIASTEDYRTGTKAFIEKTKPEYKGR